MSREHTFKLTVSNNKTEKEGINYLIENETGFLKIDKEMKKALLEKVQLPVSFLQSFDLVYIPRLKGVEFKEKFIETHLNELLFIELKTTKKYLPNNPKGFFFGATENEFKFGELLGDKFRFCFVCLNEKSQSYAMLTINELTSIIKNKRIQFQINL